jgi:hypothetical protein
MQTVSLLTGLDWLSPMQPKRKMRHAHLLSHKRRGNEQVPIVEIYPKAPASRATTSYGKEKEGRRK